jgi:hypothetical protein
LRHPRSPGAPLMSHSGEVQRCNRKQQKTNVGSRDQRTACGPSLGCCKTEHDLPVRSFGRTRNRTPKMLPFRHSACLTCSGRGLG